MQADKIKHAIVGAAIAILGAGLSLLTWYEAAFLLVLAVGVANEVRDYIEKRGRAEIMDAVATIGGGIIGIAAIYAVMWYGFT